HVPIRGLSLFGVSAPGVFSTTGIDARRNERLPAPDATRKEDPAARRERWRTSTPVRDAEGRRVWRLDGVLERERAPGSRDYEPVPLSGEPIPAEEPDRGSSGWDRIRLDRVQPLWDGFELRGSFGDAYGSPRWPFQG